MGCMWDPGSIGTMQNPDFMGLLQDPGSMDPRQDPGSSGPMQDPCSIGPMQDTGPWVVWAHKLDPICFLFEPIHLGSFGVHSIYMALLAGWVQLGPRCYPLLSFRGATIPTAPIGFIPQHYRVSQGMSYGGSQTILHNSQIVARSVVCCLLLQRCGKVP